MAGHYTIHGALGSPCSMKLRAVLRYRRLPHVWANGGAALAAAAAAAAAGKAKKPLIPILAYRDGSFANDSTPLIYDLAALEAHVTDRHCLFSTRPSLAEFGLYGQISQLGVDPTPEAMLRRDYPYVLRWLLHIDDMSGIEGEWDAPDATPAPVAETLLGIIGELYFPFLIANAAGLATAADTFAFTAMGHDHTQGTFRYQAKCLADLRARFAALPAAARAGLEPLLARTACLAPLQAE